MPIVHMARNTDFNGDYPEGTYAPLNSDYQPAERRTFESALLLYSTHHGLCVAEREHNGHDDSDFYMTVWNPETGAPETVMFATTRGWCYPCLGSAVDATPEVKAAYAAWQKAAAEKEAKRLREREARRPRLHCNVTITSAITRGKNKVEAGAKGDVFWIGTDRDSRSRYRNSYAASLGLTDPRDGMRLGVRLLDGRRIFIDALKCEVEQVQPAQAA